MIEAKDGREGSRVQIFGRHQIKLTAAQLCERKRQVQLKVPSGLPSSLPFPSPLSLSRLSLYRNHSESSADFPPKMESLHSTYASPGEAETLRELSKNLCRTSSFCWPNKHSTTWWKFMWATRELSQCRREEEGKQK